MKYTYQPNLINYNNTKIKSLHRYAIKGLAGDVVSSMKLYDGDGTFEDDRRFALLYVNDYNNDMINKFDEDNPKWLHKVGILANDRKMLHSYSIIQIRDYLMFTLHPSSTFNNNSEY